MEKRSANSSCAVRTVHIGTPSSRNWPTTNTFTCVWNPSAFAPSISTRRVRPPDALFRGCSHSTRYQDDAQVYGAGCRLVGCNPSKDIIQTPDTVLTV